MSDRPICQRCDRRYPIVANSACYPCNVEIDREAWVQSHPTLISRLDAIETIPGIGVCLGRTIVAHFEDLAQDDPPPSRLDAIEERLRKLEQQA